MCIGTCLTTTTTTTMATAATAAIMWYRRGAVCPTVGSLARSTVLVLVVVMLVLVLAMRVLVMLAFVGSVWC
jgi:hypothetical protein